EQFVVDLPGGLEGVPDVVAKILVRERALDVRTSVSSPFQYLVSRLAHPSVVLSLGWQAVRTREESSQTSRFRRQPTDARGVRGRWRACRQGRSRQRLPLLRAGRLGRRP